MFEYKESGGVDNLTVVEIDGQVWFVANEVCALLDIKNPRDAVSRLDEDEKRLSALPTSSGNQKLNLISESGLYTLVFKSNKPSAKAFQKWVTKEVIPAIRKTGSYTSNKSNTPNFVQRFNDNYDRISTGYFSVISELFIRLHGRFERIGYNIPDKAFNGKEIRPDNSVGRRFSTYLQKHHPEHEDKFKMYNHLFPNGYEFEARQYENELLPIFIKFIDEIWIPEVAHDYFKQRDSLALEYIPKLLPPK
jgi:prophage antirepressor-like protein